MFSMLMARLSNFFHGYLPIWVIVGEILVLVSCVTGDMLLEHASFHFTGSAWAKALTDNLTHGVVALFSWLIVRADINPLILREMIVCMMMAMFVDSDHFIAARSFNIHNATSLSHRPPFHNSSLIIIITFLLIVLSQTWPGPPSSLVHHIPCIFVIAWTSHHMRDATRRGLWFWPLGSTRPLPKYLYISCTMLLPLLARFLMLHLPAAVPLKLKSSSSGIIDV